MDEIDFNLHVDEDEIVEVKKEIVSDEESCNNENDYCLDLGSGSDDSEPYEKTDKQSKENDMRTAWINGKYVCNLCGMSFMWYSSLQRHLKTKCIIETPPRKKGRPRKH